MAAINSFDTITESTEDTPRSANPSFPNTSVDTTSKEEIKNRSIKDPEPCKAILQGQRDERLLRELLAHVTSLEGDFAELRKSHKELQDRLSVLEKSQELDNAYFKDQLARQDIILRFETLSRILQSLNDLILQKVHSTYASRLNLLYGLNYIDRMLVNANGTHKRPYTNDQFREEVQRLVQSSAALLVPGTRPFGVVDTGNLNHDRIRAADPPPLYAKKLLQFLSDGELRLALQVFVLMNHPQNPLRDSTNRTAHMRPSTKHAEEYVSLFSAEDADFETAIALRIIKNNAPFLDSRKPLPFGQIKDNQDLQHSLASRVAKAEAIEAIQRRGRVDSGGP